MQNCATSLIAYVRQLCANLSRATAQTTGISEVEAVHHARVATRRLGSAIELLQPWLVKKSHKQI